MSYKPLRDWLLPTSVALALAVPFHIQPLLHPSWVTCRSLCLAPLHLAVSPQPLSFGLHITSSGKAEAAHHVQWSGCPPPSSCSTPDRLTVTACQPLDGLSLFRTKALEGRIAWLSVPVTQPGPAWLRARPPGLVNERAVSQAAPSGCPQCQPARNYGPEPTTGCGLSPTENKFPWDQPMPFISLNRTSTGRGGSKLELFLEQ